MNVRSVWGCPGCALLGLLLVGGAVAPAQPAYPAPSSAIGPAPATVGGVTARPLLITAIEGDQATLSAGFQSGVVVGAFYTLTRSGRVVARLQVVSVSPTVSMARIETVPTSEIAIGTKSLLVVVGDVVELNTPSIIPTVSIKPYGLVPQSMSLSAVPAPGTALPSNAPVLEQGRTLAARLMPQGLATPASVTAQASQTLVTSLPVSTRSSGSANEGFVLVVPPGAAQNAPFESVQATVLALSLQGEVTLSVGRAQGVRVGDTLPVVREGQSPGQVRVRTLAAERSTGTFEPNQAGAVLAVGDSVLIEGGKSAALSSRSARNGDYLAALGVTLLVLSAQRNPSRDLDKQTIATQQFSAISPFPGGGYSVLPSGEIAPGGAMGINMPIAYVPHELSGVVGVYAAQNRRGDSLTSSDGRNGTLNTGLGFGVRGRGVWLSRMGLSTISLGGGDSVYNLAVQLAPETSRFPAIAVGAQDVTNRRQRAPFVVATKALGGSSRPLYASVGLGKGRFSTVFGGLSYSPLRRLALSAEYDGLQFNVGAGLSITRRFTLLVSANDLSSSNHAPIGELGRRYQLGGTLTF